MFIIDAYYALQAHARLGLSSYQIEKLATHQIFIKVDYCGVCHSDLRFIANEFGDSHYPLIAGHEIIGTVCAIGRDVTQFKLGDRVATAWQQGCCETCHWCRTQHEEVCEKIEAICLTHRGGFASNMAIDANFAHLLPASLANAAGAPLLCAGTTIFNALLACGITKGMRVGVVGIGGLGHLAIKFLHAMQCDIIAFSSTADKEQDARQFGASHFVDSTKRDAISQFNNCCDAIIYTPDVNLDYEAFFNVLKPFGIFCFAGIPMDAPTLPIFPLVIGEKSIKAVTCGNRNTVKTMLEFAAKHHILADIEIMPMSQINDALVKVKKRQMRYRLVLENDF